MTGDCFESVVDMILQDGGFSGPEQQPTPWAIDRSDHSWFPRFGHYFVEQTVTYPAAYHPKEDTPFGLVVGRLQREIPGLGEIAWEEAEVP